MATVVDGGGKAEAGDDDADDGAGVVAVEDVGRCVAVGVGVDDGCDDSEGGGAAETGTRC